MIEFWFPIVFYGLLTLAVTLLLVRYVRRIRRERAAAVRQPAPPEQQQAAALSDATPEPPPAAVPDSQALKPPVRREPPHETIPAAQNRSWANTSLPRIEPDEIPHADTSDYVFGPLTPVLAAALPESEARRLEARRELRNAGWYQPHAWQNLAAIRYMGIMACLLLCGGLIVLLPPRFEGPLIGMMVTSALLAWALPRLYVKGKAAERLSQIEHAMPDMLDMLNMCVSQGIPLQDALSRISRDLRGVYPALAQELRIISEHAEVGSLSHALESFSRRIELPEVHSFASLMIQTDRMGTSVSAALSDYSDNIRESLRQRADEKANKASFKLLFPTALCLMPAVYMFLLGPAVVELSNFFNEGGRDQLDAGQRAVGQLQSDNQ